MKTLKVGTNLTTEEHDVFLEVLFIETKDT